MLRRWGLGPVFVYEWLVASRRWQMYALRALVVGVLLAALVLVWESELRDRRQSNLGRQPLSYKDYGHIGEQFFNAVIGTQLTLILLAAPGATAGAVCLDKMRGNLLHLLVTDLSAAEVVLGKLAARLLPVLGLIACSVPVLMIGTLLGGLDPGAVLGAYAVLLGVGVLGSALALLFSVWGRKPHEVLLVVYLIELLWLLAYPIWWEVDRLLRKAGAVPNWLPDLPDRLRDLNPYSLAFAPYERPNTVIWGDYGQFLLVTFAAAAVCTLLAVACVRPWTLRHGGVTRRPKAPTARARRRWGPVLDRNPLLWYEWHRKRPSRWVRAVWGMYALLALAGTGLVLLGATGRIWEGAVIVNMLQVSVGLLLAGVAAVTSLAEERVRGSLDVLLATPLSTRAIVWAKWRAAFRPVVRLAVLPAVVIIAVAWGEGYSRLPVPAAGNRWAAWTAWLDADWYLAPLLAALILAYGAFLTSLGLALATWIARTGRAIGAWVALYALQCIGWPLLVSLLSEPNLGSQADRLGPALASPVFGSGVVTEFVGDGWGLSHAYDVVVISVWSGFWVLSLLGAAAVLYYLTLATFNRCLSRVPEAGPRRRKERPVRPPAVPV